MEFVMNKNILDLGIKLKKFNKEFIEGKHRIIVKNTIYNSSFLFLYYFLGSEYFKNSPYRDILINYFKKSDNLYPGSSYFTSVKLVNKIFSNNNKINLSKSETNLETIYKYLNSITDNKSFSVFRKIIEFSGPDGILNLKVSKNSKITVEKSRNPVFNIKIHPAFSNIYFNKVENSTKNVLMTIIDGYIERESEIIPFIEKMKENKVPGVLICRGISDNAAKHLKNILLRNKLYLYPYIEKFNNEDPFLFEDISKIIGITQISSEFMDNIYKEITRKCKIIKATLSRKSISFYEKNTELINEINSQLSGCNNNVKEYLMKRKKRCSPNNITIYIPEMMKSTLREITGLIKCYNVCSLTGFLQSNSNIFSKYCEETSDRLSDSLYKTITNIGYTVRLS
tara:strand:- start:1350 stop:2540 length:1191 start_codon:yes stop_codon:yes gene_type:complete